MENTELIEKVAHLEEREKSNTKRIDEHGLINWKRHTQSWKKWITEWKK